MYKAAAHSQSGQCQTYQTLGYGFDIEDSGGNGVIYLMLHFAVFEGKLPYK